MLPAKPRISVIITSHNQKQFLVEAIESVLDQTLPPFEIIVGEDCSTDGSRECLAEYAGQYPGLVRPLFHTRNLGRAENRNAGLREAHGDLTTVLDGDDRFLPRKLESEVAALRVHPEADIAYSNVYFIDPTGHRIGVRADEHTSQPSGYIFPRVFAHTFPHDGTIRNELVKMHCWQQVELYDKRFAFFEDWDLRIRLTKLFKVAYCSEPLIEYRRHPGSLSSRTPVSALLKDAQEVYTKNRHLLDDLSPSEQAPIQKGPVTLLAALARKAAKEAAQRGAPQLVIQYSLDYLRYDPKGFVLKLWRDTGSRLLSRT